MHHYHPKNWPHTRTNRIGREPKTYLCFWGLQSLGFKLCTKSSLQKKSLHGNRKCWMATRYESSSMIATNARNLQKKIMHKIIESQDKHFNWLLFPELFDKLDLYPSQRNRKKSFSEKGACEVNLPSFRIRRNMHLMMTSTGPQRWRWEH